MKSYWRPAMGWLYMLICFCDFVAFPVISMFLPVMIKGLPYVAWKSITLDNGGLIHLAFGAILGVTAYGRTQEKIAGSAVNPAPVGGGTFTPIPPTPPIPPAPTFTPAPSFSATPAPGFGGKPAPVQPPHPEL